MQFGSHLVPYVSPEKVQDYSHIRVLIAKDAISTGWDCPRAEVMVSFRPAQDRTHITQLLGRMVRTPLARRVPGNDLLNSVDCLLPYFNRDTVGAVADALINGDDKEDPPPPGRRVLTEPIETFPVSGNGFDDAWEKLLSLPSQSVPRTTATPVKRLTSLAQELAADGLLPDAGKLAHEELHRVLDAARARFSDDVETAVDNVYTVEGQTLVGSLGTGDKSFAAFTEEADTAVIDDAYRRAGRAISPDLARTYAEYLAEQSDQPTDDALLDAHAKIAALGLVPKVKAYLDKEAESISAEWFTKYRVAIKGLSDERRDAYRQILEMSAEPQDVELAKPAVQLVPSKVRAADGTETDLPTRKKHLMAPKDVDFPVDLNEWETQALDRELGREGFIAWYRNPAHSGQDSFAVAYRMDGAWKSVRPDFIVFSENADGSVAASIVDPHGYQLSDALPKLLGLADYAEQHPGVFARIDAVAKIGDKLRVLDLTETSVRDAVRSADSARELYDGPHAAAF